MKLTGAVCVKAAEATQGHKPGIPRFAAIILAAGGAPSRGLPSQLTVWRGRTLVEHAVRNALAAGAREIVVVAGEQADQIRRRLQGLPVSIVVNHDWREGMARSIRIGVSTLKTSPQAAIICLCDQPRVTSGHLRMLVERVLLPGGVSIAASAYEGVLGAPAAFHRSEFANLLTLEGNHGARRLIRESSDPVEAIQFDNANEPVKLDPAQEPPLLLRSQSFVATFFDNSSEARAPPQGRLSLWSTGLGPDPVPARFI